MSRVRSRSSLRSKYYWDIYDVTGRKDPFYSRSGIPKKGDVLHGTDSSSIVAKVFKHKRRKYVALEQI